MSYKKIAEELGINPNTLRRQISEARRKQGEEFTLEDYINSLRRVQQPLDELIKGFKAYRRRERSVSVPSRHKVVIGGDIHGNPSEQLMYRIAAEQPNVIILAGDLLDCGALNPHGRAERVVSLATEIQRVRAMLEFFLRETDAMIYAIRGNHDDWFDREVAKIVPELREFLSNPIDLIFFNMGERVRLNYQTLILREPAHHDRESAGELRYMMTYGDIAISHFSFSGSKPGDGVHKLRLRLNEWRHTLGLQDARVFIQAHTHNVSYAELDGGHVVQVECGMMCERDSEGYKLGHRFSWRPGVIGAFVCEVEDGHYISRSGRFV